MSLDTDKFLKFRIIDFRPHMNYDVINGVRKTLTPILSYLISITTIKANGISKKSGKRGLKKQTRSKL